MAAQLKTADELYRGAWNGVPDEFAARFGTVYAHYADAEREHKRLGGALVKPSLTSWRLLGSWEEVDAEMKKYVGRLGFAWYYCLGDQPRKLRFDVEAKPDQVDRWDPEEWHAGAVELERAFYDFLRDRHPDLYEEAERVVSNRRSRIGVVHAHRDDKYSTHIVSAFVFEDQVAEFRCMMEFRIWLGVREQYGPMYPFIDWGIYGRGAGSSTLRMAGSAKADGSAMLTSEAFEYFKHNDPIECHRRFNPQFVSSDGCTPVSRHRFEPSGAEQEEWRREDARQRADEVEAPDPQTLPETRELQAFICRQLGLSSYVLMRGRTVTALRYEAADISIPPGMDWGRVWFRVACALPLGFGGRAAFWEFVTKARPDRPNTPVRRSKYDDRLGKTAHVVRRPMSMRYLARMMCLPPRCVQVYTRNDRGDVYLHTNGRLDEGRFVGNLHWTHPEEIINMRYVDIPFGEGVLALSSPMGTGKTQFLKRLCEGEGKKTVVVSCRRTLARHLAQELDALLYINQKAADLCNAQRLVIQLESLGMKWAKHHARSGALPTDIDVLAVDEFVSLMMHFGSDTMAKWRRLCAEALGHLMRHARTVVLLDADMTPDAAPLQFVREVAPNRPIRIVRNITPPDPRRTYTFMNYDALLHKLNEATDEGVRIGVVCTNRALLHTVMNALERRGARGVKVYSSDTSDEDVERDMRSVDDAWADMQVVGFTSTITVGVDYNGPERTIFAVVDPNSTDAQQVVQMTGRFRKAVAIFVAFTDRDVNNDLLHLPDTQDEIVLCKKAVMADAVQRYPDFMTVGMDGSIVMGDTKLDRLLAWVAERCMRSRNHCRREMCYLIRMSGNSIVLDETLFQAAPAGNELSQSMQDGSREYRGESMTALGDALRNAMPSDQTPMGTQEHRVAVLRERIERMLQLGPVGDRDARWWALVAHSLPQLVRHAVLESLVDERRMDDARKADLWSVMPDTTLEIGETPLMALYLTTGRIDEPVVAAPFQGAEIIALAELMLELRGQDSEVVSRETFTSERYCARYRDTMQKHPELVKKLGLKGNLRNGELTVRNRATFLQKCGAYFGLKYSMGTMQRLFDPAQPFPAAPPHLSKLF